MKYYIKITNKETNESMVMSVPVFTSKKKAEEWAKELDKAMNDNAKSEVISEV